MERLVQIKIRIFGSRGNGSSMALESGYFEMERKNALDFVLRNCLVWLDSFRYSLERLYIK